MISDGGDGSGVDAFDALSTDIASDAPTEAWSDAPSEQAPTSCDDAGLCGPGEMCAFEPGCAMPRRHCVANTCGDAIVVTFCGCDGRLFAIQGCLAAAVPFALRGACASDDAGADGSSADGGDAMLDGGDGAIGCGEARGDFRPSMCAPSGATAEPGCRCIIGWHFDGTRCAALGGCRCLGNCDRVYADESACRIAYAGCLDGG